MNAVEYVQLPPPRQLSAVCFASFEGCRVRAACVPQQQACELRRPSRAQVALAQGRTAHAGVFAQATVRPVTFEDFLAAVNKIRGP